MSWRAMKLEREALSERKTLLSVDYGGGHLEPGYLEGHFEDL